MKTSQWRQAVSLYVNIYSSSSRWCWW